MLVKHQVGRIKRDQRQEPKPEYQTSVATSHTLVFLSLGSASGFLRSIMEDQGVLETNLILVSF